MARPTRLDERLSLVEERVRSGAVVQPGRVLANAQCAAWLIEAAWWKEQPDDAPDGRIFDLAMWVHQRSKTHDIWQPRDVARHAWTDRQTNELIRLALAAGVDADWLLDRLRP